MTLPEIGWKVTFTEGKRNPRTWEGEVADHDEDGCLIFWPKMRYRKKIGVMTHHTVLWPEYFKVIPCR